MAFVWSSWYIVMILLVAGIAACLTVFFLMDKKDKILINKFIEEASAPQEKVAENVEEKVEHVEEEKSNE